MTILRYVFFGLAVFIAAGIGWRTAGGLHVRIASDVPVVRAAQPPRSAPPVMSSAQRLERARAEIIDHLKDVPQFTAFYTELSTAFPSVYDDLVDHAAKTLTEGGPLPSSSALIWEALRDLQQSHGILASSADGDALAMFFNARLSMLDLLATVDQRTCADFLYGTTDPDIEAFSLTHRDLVADMAGKLLAAIEDGQRKHLVPSDPSNEDLDLVAKGLAARKLNPDEIAMLLDGKAVDPPLPDGRLCELGRTYLSVLKELPPDVRQRIYGFTAELLARS